jgi:DNA polymerase III epsilon subunit family exonuclease
LPARRHPEPLHYLPGVPLAFVDVETTGLSSSEGHRICEIAILRVESEGTEREFQSLVNPKRRISAGAFAVNQITTDMLKTAPQFPELIPMLEEHLCDAVLVAHNAPFDLGFLVAEYERAGRNAVFARVIDTLVMARTLIPEIRHGLPSLCQALHVATVGAHRAMADCRATRGVLDALVANHWGGAPPEAEALLSTASRFQPQPISFDELPHDLAQALRRNARIWITYESADGSKSERWIVVRGAVSSGRGKSLVAHCETRKSERQFRLDRIRKWHSADDVGSSAASAGVPVNNKDLGSVVIRPMRGDELPAMRDLWVAARLTHKPKGRDRMERLAAEMESGRAAFIGAYLDSQLVGTVIATDDGRRGWINRLAVHPDYRGRDIARALIRAAESYLRGLGIAVLDALIDADNEASRQLFNSEGYVQVPDILYFTKRPSRDV